MDNQIPLNSYEIIDKILDIIKTKNELKDDVMTINFLNVLIEIIKCVIYNEDLINQITLLETEIDSINNVITNINSDFRKKK